MGLYIAAVVVGGLVNLFFYFWTFYGPDESIFQGLWKDILENLPFKKNASPKRVCWKSSITDNGCTLLYQEFLVYSSPSVFWLKIIKYFVVGGFVGMGILHIL